MIFILIWCIFSFIWIVRNSMMLLIDCDVVAEYIYVIGCDMVDDKDNT